MNNDIVIREAKEDDIPKIIELHRSQSGVFIGKDIWNWQYFRKRGYDTFFVVAEKKGRIVGTQALIPIKILGHGEVFLSGKSEATLVHKSFRGHGIFDKMYAKLFEMAEQKGINIIWGFTQATKAFSKTGFNIPENLSIGYIPLNITDNFTYFFGKLRKYFGCVSCLVAPLLVSFLIFCRLRLCICLFSCGLKYSSKIGRIGSLAKKTKEYDELLTIMNDRYKKNEIITIYRDSEYMNWRIFNNPSINYKIITYSNDVIKGYLIFYIKKDILVITDYYTEHDEIFPLLLHNALIYGLKKKCKSVQYFDNESLENKKYRKYFNYFSSIKFNNMNPMVFKKIGKGLHNDEQNTDIKRWFITEIFSQGT